VLVEASDLHYQKYQLATKSVNFAVHFSTLMCSSWVGSGFTLKELEWGNSLAFLVPAEERKS
jgi:hypothetical protein